MGQARRRSQNQRELLLQAVMCGPAAAEGPFNVTFLVDPAQPGQLPRLYELLPETVSRAFVEHTVAAIMQEAGAACRHLQLTVHQTRRVEIHWMPALTLEQLQAGCLQNLWQFAVRQQRWAWVLLVDAALAAPLESFCRAQAVAAYGEPRSYQGPPFDVQQQPHPGLDQVLQVSVPRQMVETQTWWPVLQVLDRLVARPASLRAALQRVRLSFDGYAGETREVFEVPELMAYVQVLARAAPWWPLLAAPDALLVWLGALVPLQKIGRGAGGRFRAGIAAGISPDDVVRQCAAPLPAFLNASFDFSHQEIQRMTGDVVRVCTSILSVPAEPATPARP